MKKILFLFVVVLPFALVAYTLRPPRTWDNAVVGTPEIKSMNALAFGPDGALFIGDSKSGAIFALDTKDVAKADKAAPVEIKNLDQKIAAFLGTEPKNITIQDLKVNPVSKNIYCAVQATDGTPVLLKLAGGIIQAVSLQDIRYSSLSLNNLPAEEAKGRNGRPLRVAAISDLDFADGKVLVSGLSNQEFGSTFRSIPFPFKKAQEQASLEIYHAAHGRYETDAPIESFTTAALNGQKFLIASYTCTPLVLFPLQDLKAGTHVKGRTVGEFGAGNRPLDMITMQKGNDLFLILANTNRPMMKVKYKDIETYQGALTAPVQEAYATAGVPYVSFPVVNVLQLDRLDDTQFVYVQRTATGDLNLMTRNNESL